MDKSRSTRILIADSPGIFRDGLRKLLDAQPDFRVIGEASDGVQAVKAVHELKPNILVLDPTLPQNAGLEVSRELECLAKQVRTLLLVASIDKGLLIKALQVGVRGVVLKDSATRLLIQGIRSVMAGQYWVAREAISDLIGALRDPQPSPNGKGQSKNLHLTARELEIVATIVAGHTNKDIARKFSLSEQTIKHHLTSIFGKVGVSNRLELALFAINNRLVAN